MQSFVDYWRKHDCDLYLCDGAFGSSALGPPNWLLPVPWMKTIRWTLKSVRVSEVTE